MNQYNIVIIGCGSIGANKPDYIDYPGAENILTHANAVDRHPQTELLAIVDTDSEQLTKAKAKWNPQLSVRSYKGLILHGGKVPDIVVVAVPTELHYEILHQIFMNSINQMPKLIIAEKPFCPNLDESRLIAESYSNINVPIMINYIRRYVPGYKDIKERFITGEFGKALNCRILYTRGWQRESCHAIDLLNYFFGKCLHKKILPCAPIYDYSQEDPTFSAFFNFEKCDNIIFQSCDGRNFGIFEMDIIFEKGRIRFIDNGLYIEKYPILDKNEWGHKSLDYSLVNVIRIETGLNTALYNLLDNAVKFLDGKEELICTAKDAIAVHKILEIEK
jgi:predicted dehydrogenase